MKNRLIYTAICLIAASMLSLAPAALASAPPVITYDRYSAPRITSSESNLFPNFESLMPGDQRTQTIIVRNKNAYKLGTYFRCYPIQNGAEVRGQEAEELMDKLNLKVNVGDDGKEIFSGTVAQLLKKGSEGSDALRYLTIATLWSGKETPIKFNLSLDKDVDNAFASKDTKFGFELAVERISSDSGGGGWNDPDKDTQAKNPKTGGKGGLWLLLGGFGAVSCGTILGYRSRRRIRV